LKTSSKRRKLTHTLPIEQQIRIAADVIVVRRTNPSFSWEDVLNALELRDEREPLATQVKILKIMAAERRFTALKYLERKQRLDDKTSDLPRE
jgi:hypothetical protein